MKKNYAPYLILFFSIIIASIFWDYISLPYNINYDFGGEYFEKSYNLNNDILRFIFFMSVCLVPFLFHYKKINKFNTYNINEFFNFDFQGIEKPSKLNYFYLFILILFCSLNFLKLNFSRWVAPLDLFHEGLWLTSSYNYTQTRDFWTSNYFERGIFGNFYPVFIWKILSTETIGAVRFADLFLLYLNKILLIFLSFNIAKNINWHEYKKITFFILLSLLLLTLVPYDDQGQFVKRSPLIILFLNFLIFSFDNKNKKIIYILLGLFSSVSFLWYLDVAAYLNFILLILIIFFLIKKNFKKIFYLIFGIFLSWILFYLFFSLDEIKLFIFTIKTVFLTMDQIHGIIYPTPFFSGETRATKALLFHILGGIFTIFICLNKNDFNNNNKYFFLFLFILSLVSFKTGLSRSDDPHIKTSTGPLLILIYSYLLYYIFNNNFFKIIYERYKNLKFNNIILLLIIFAFFNLNNLSSIKSFNKNFKYLVNSNDSKFLTHHNQDYNELIDYINSNFKNLNCIQVLNDDVALPYLLKKKSCTKYYVSWNITPKFLQNELILEIKKNEPIIIILEKNNKFTPNLKLVENFVFENYFLYTKIKNWEIFKKIK